MQVELNNEAVDGLMKSILLQDYHGLVEDTDRLKKLKNKSDAQLRDLEHNKEYLAAYEKLLEYYVGFHWKEEL
jgi:hypothetical protein